MKNFISKEVFKIYYTECSKLAVAMADDDVFEKFIKLVKNKTLSILKMGKMESHITNADSNEDESSLAPIDPIKSFIKMYESMEQDEDIEKKLMLLYDMDDEEIGIAGGVTASSINDGNEFGQVVREYFFEINESNNIINHENKGCVDLQAKSFKEAEKISSQILEDQNNKFIFESAFQWGGTLRIRPDVLENVGNNHINIFEAKANTWSAKKQKKGIKNEHILDIAYQMYVLQKLGYIVDNVYLCYINADYQRNYGNTNFSDDSDDLKFFAKLKTIDFKRDVKPILDNLTMPKLEEAEDLDYKMLVICVDKNIEMPLIKCVGDLVDQMDDLFDTIDQDITSLKNKDQDSIIDYFTSRDHCSRIKFINKSEFAFKNKACDFVIEYYDFNVPNIFWFFNASKLINFIKDYNIFYLKDMTEPTFFYTTRKKEPKPYFKLEDFSKRGMMLDVYNDKQIDDKRLLIGEPEYFNELLDEYKQMPIYMYDFETAMWAIPRFAKQSAYDQTVFQYSIHIVNQENDFFDGSYNKNHKAWLKKIREDPRPEFIFHFLVDAFSAGPGVYVAYNKSFEIQILRKLAANFPEFKAPLMYICQNTIDLLDFFKKSVIYHPKFKRSNSIKYTQPALYPELQYTDLVINRGDKSAFIFRQYIDNLLGDDSQKFWDEIQYDEMLKYCKRDTEAMIVLFKRILEIKRAYVGRLENAKN